MDFNPKSPWNPGSIAQITPSQFEKVVRGWLKSKTAGISAIRTKHQARKMGSGGSYAIDVMAWFKIFGGAEIVILVECKYQERPVERDEIIILEGKLRDVGAHKGMVFDTSGFQRGALKYAKSRGIATITVVGEEWLYETRSAITPPLPQG